MKVAIIFIALSGVFLVSAEGPGSDATAEIVKYEEEPSIEGNYHYSFETSNGLKVTQESTFHKAENKDENDTLTVSGSYSYLSPDGEPIEVKYRVDPQHGYVAESPILPTPPPIPEAIKLALEYIESHTAKDPKKETKSDKPN